MNENDNPQRACPECTFLNASWRGLCEICGEVLEKVTSTAIEPPKTNLRMPLVCSEDEGSITDAPLSSLSDSNSVSSGSPSHFLSQMSQKRPQKKKEKIFIDLDSDSDTDVEDPTLSRPVNSLPKPLAFSPVAQRPLPPSPLPALSPHLPPPLSPQLPPLSPPFPPLSPLLTSHTPPLSPSPIPSPPPKKKQKTKGSRKGSQNATDNQKCIREEKKRLRARLKELEKQENGDAKEIQRRQKRRKKEEEKVDKAHHKFLRQKASGKFQHLEIKVFYHPSVVKRAGMKIIDKLRGEEYCCQEDSLLTGGMISIKRMAVNQHHEQSPNLENPYTYSLLRLNERSLADRYLKDPSRLNVTSALSTTDELVLLIENVNNYLKDNDSYKHLTDVKEEVGNIWLTLNVRYHFLKNVDETADYLARVCRSLCGAPYRKDINPLTFGTKVKARRGDSELKCNFRGFLMKFEGVSEKQADFIMENYPTFRSLYSAFKSSGNPEAMLQDIRIGTNKSAKRLGPKMSKKLYKYVYEFTEGNETFV